MAARRNAYGKPANRPQQRGGMYIYGNTVRKAEAIPNIREDEPRRAVKKQPSLQVQINRRRAQRMSRGYVAFLSFAAVIALTACVWYLQMRSELTSRAENITALQQELADLKEENTTRYNAVMDSVSLEDVRNRAIGEMGMVYADSGQIISYQNPVGDYVKQYKDIPENGVLAQSGETR